MMEFEKKELSLGVFKLYEDAKVPEFKTQGAACWDIYTYITDAVTLNGRRQKLDSSSPWITLSRGDLLLVPTGLILKIPHGYSVRLHPRSGLASIGLTLANCEGIIDSDYTDELQVALIYHGKEPTIIGHQQRIAQGELVRNLQYNINTIYTAPEKQEREGGFGSTGVY